MEPDRDLRAALRGVLDAVENAPPVQAVEAATRGLQDVLGAGSVSFLIADLSGRALVRMPSRPVPHRGSSGTSDGGAVTTAGATSPHDVRDPGMSEPLDGGPAERALLTQVVQVLPPATGAGGPDRGRGSWTVLAPVIERGEALGLLEIVLPAEPGDAVIEEIARTAHLLAFVVVASRRHTDVYEWAQRSTPYSLSAEIQRRLLPPAYTCEAGSFTLSAWLEPSNSVGGDTYDYSVARDVLHLSMTDAMGHGVDSALTATLCVASLRNGRRLGLSLLEQAATTNDALCNHHREVPAESFCTGLLGRLDLATGNLDLVNAGHVAPYLLRDGAVVIVDVPPSLPFGLFAQADYVATVVPLRAGDRLVLVTDGMLERNAESLDLSALITATADLHAREATRALTDEVLEATGRALADDATLLMLDWHGHHDWDRNTHAGSSSGLEATTTERPSAS